MRPCTCSNDQMRPGTSSRRRHVARGGPSSGVPKTSGPAGAAPVIAVAARGCPAWESGRDRGADERSPRLRSVGGGRQRWTEREDGEPKSRHRSLLELLEVPRVDVAWRRQRQGARCFTVTCNPGDFTDLNCIGRKARPRLARGSDPTAPPYAAAIDRNASCGSVGGAQTSSLMPNLSLIALMNSSFSISPVRRSGARG